nr:putative ER lumen protein-retaining receptor C28H8.4 [Ipomoea batatas]
MAAGELVVDGGEHDVDEITIISRPTPALPPPDMLVNPPLENVVNFPVQPFHGVNVAVKIHPFEQRKRHGVPQGPGQNPSQGDGLAVEDGKVAEDRPRSGDFRRTQEITALFLAIRLCCSFCMEADIHTALDFVTLLSTLWVMYMIRFKLKFTYMAELDSMPIYYIIVPAAILALFVHPYTDHILPLPIFWAFCVFLESVSVLPQLRMMQKAKMIEPFTAHYVFALGIARFLGCAHWFIRVYETRGAYLYMVGRGYFWIPTVFLSEMVQTFILADFCYYYVKSAVNGQLLITLQSPV